MELICIFYCWLVRDSTLVDYQFAHTPRLKNDRVPTMCGIDLSPKS